MAHLTLITGQPGNGKTAHAVDLVANHPDFKGRPLFVRGIKELLVPHIPVPPIAEWTERRKDPEDESIESWWFTFPVNAVLLIDEAQHIFRPRAASSKVPPEVAAFETFRHTGIDIILLTQHPGLLDANIRKLVTRHQHIRVTWLGGHLFEWGECGDPESTASRNVASRSKYKLPKGVFKLYKSAELHTKRSLSIPWQFYLLVFGVVSLAALTYYIYGRIQAVNSGSKAGGVQSVSGPVKQGAGTTKPKMSLEEYLQENQPRLEGLMHTAPIYDEVTKPVDAPWPSGCMKSERAGCRCYDQQGNRYATTEQICKQIVATGIFKPFGQALAKSVPAGGGGSPVPVVVASGH